MKKPEDILCEICIMDFPLRPKNYGVLNFSILDRIYQDYDEPERELNGEEDDNW